MLNRVKANFTGAVRNDSMAGKDYLVAPMVMIVEGVHNGSHGPLFYPGEELGKIPAIWNTKPIVVYHPAEGHTACDPDILTNRQVGLVMNTRFEDGKLKAEAWLDPVRMDVVDDRIGEAVKNNKMMELSTGLFTDEESVENGEWNGKEYTTIARNYRPDHLALLPDMKGACSVEDGAGFLRMNAVGDSLTMLFNDLDDEKKKEIKKNEKEVLREVTHFILNELSFDDIRFQLRGLVQAKEGDDDAFIWIEDVFDSNFIYEKDGRLFQQDYTITKEIPALVGLPVEVVRKTEFIEKTIVNKMKGITMKIKKKLVDGLISNESTQWAEGDREVLMNLDVDVLDLMEPVENEKKEPEKEAKENEVQAAAEKGAEEVAAKTNKTQTTDEYIESAPPEIKAMLQNQRRRYDAEKTRLINTITANDRNTYKPEFLKEKDVEELTALAALAAPAVPDNGEPISNQRFDYSGQAQTQNSHDGSKIEPLEPPTMNFGPEQKQE